MANQTNANIPTRRAPSNLSNLRILITGGAGFVGSAIAAALTKLNCSVLTYDNFACDKRNLSAAKHENLTVVDGDILDARLLRSITNDFGPTHVMRLAALHYIPYCETNRGRRYR